MNLDPEVVSLGVRLTEAAARNSVEELIGRIRAAKTRKDAGETIELLEEIIDELTEDRTELLRVARAYREQLVDQQLTDDEIEHVTSQIVPTIARLAELAADDESRAEDLERFVEILKPLLSAETITVLQVLGFNFKAAIGEPLTEVLASLIRTQVRPGPDLNAELQALGLRNQTMLAQLCEDEDAFARFRELFPAARASG